MSLRALVTLVLLSVVSASAWANTPPTAYNQRQLVAKNSGTVYLRLRWQDPDAGQTWTAAVLSQPSSGTVSLSGTMYAYFTPASGFVGDVSFTWRVNDGVANSNTATYTISVRDPLDTSGLHVLVLVRSTLYPEVKAEVDRLRDDLIAEGYTSEVQTFSSTSAETLYNT